MLPLSPCNKLTKFRFILSISLFASLTQIIRLDWGEVEGGASLLRRDRRCVAHCLEIIFSGATTGEALPPSWLAVAQGPKDILPEPCATSSENTFELVVPRHQFHGMGLCSFHGTVLVSWDRTPEQEEWRVVISERIWILYFWFCLNAINVEIQ